MLKLTAPQARIDEMVEITGDPVRDITEHMTVDLLWAVRNVSLTDWGRAVQYAAYDRKSSVLGLLGWPIHELAFDVVFHACTL
jgi:hypothetical protein